MEGGFSQLPLVVRPHKRNLTFIVAARDGGFSAIVPMGRYAGTRRSCLSNGKQPQIGKKMTKGEQFA
jgi:hypothetical protein